jgi:hypothetical protein
VIASSINGEVVRDVRDLAERLGWKPVEDLAAGILSAGSRRQILVANGAAVDGTPLRQWIQEVTGAAEIAGESLEGIAAMPCRPLSAAKLVAVFECGRMLEALEVKAIAEQFLPRPLESFAIVFTRAELLESAEDLDLMERLIWRVVVPDPKRDWQRQDLLAYQCYFWTASEPQEFLRERCRRDREELAAVLRRPIDDADTELLDRARAIWLVDFAEEFVPVDRPRGDGEAGRLRQARDEIAEVRKRLVRRLDADSASLCRYATASLLELERDLVRRMEQARKGQTGVWKKTHVISGEFRQLIEHRLENGMAEWRTKLEAELNQRAGEIISETQELLRRVDWDFVNGIAGSPERPAAETLAISPADIPGRIQVPAKGEPVWMKRMISAARAIELVWLGAALSTGPLATIAVSSILTTVVLQRRARTFEQFAQPARQAIHAMSRRAIPELRTAIQTAFANYRDGLASELRQIEAALEAACARAFEAPSGDSAAGWDREQLLSLRRRL